MGHECGNDQLRSVTRGGNREPTILGHGGGGGGGGGVVFHRSSEEGVLRVWGRKGTDEKLSGEDNAFR